MAKICLITGGYIKLDKNLEYFEENNLPIDDNSLTNRLAQEVRKQCNNLADYKRVRQIDLRKQEFSKTSTRKIKRFLFETK